MQRRYIFVGLVLALLAGVFFCLRAEQRAQIDFEQVEPIPGYKMEMREPPLRVARSISCWSREMRMWRSSQAVPIWCMGKRRMYVSW